MKKEYRESLFWTGISSLILVVVFVLFSLNMTSIAVAEADPGSGAGGFLIWYVYPHQAVPGTAYASNLSTTTAYEYGVSLNVAGTKHVPYFTLFDIVVHVRANVTEAYNTSSGSWTLSWVQGLITCAGLSIGADTVMTAVEVTHSATYIWVNFYINNGGSGYQISHGQTINVTSFKFQTYS